MKRFTIFSFLLYIFLCGQFCVGQNNDTSKITNISLDSTGLLKWMVFFPGDSISQQVESFENNNWEIIYSSKPTIIFAVGKKSGARTKESARVKFHTGKNILRIKVTSPYLATSKEIEFYNIEPDIENHWPIEVDSVLSFSAAITYEFFDKRHKSVLKGYGMTADLSSLKRGTYYLQVDTVKVWKTVIKK